MLRPSVVLTWSLALSMASPAFAQDPDVILDPDSPSAKEYAIPFESARRQAAGGDRTVAGTETRPASGPLFGVGIGIRRPEDASERPKARAKRPGRTRDRDGPRQAPSAEDGGATAAPFPADRRHDAATPDSGIGSAAALGAAGAAALALAAATVLLLRRR